MRADDWPAARVATVFSEDGTRFVRLVPGTSIGDTVGFSSAPKGAPARAEIYHRQPDRSYRLVADVALANPVAPVGAILANSGHLITFDNWHNMGHGVVVAVYDPAGVRLRGYRLEDLYDAARLAKIPASVSSRWWRCAAAGFVDPTEQTKVYVMERLGGTFVVTLATGALTYSPGTASCQPVHAGGPEMAPSPPHARSVPAKP